MQIVRARHDTEGADCYSAPGVKVMNSEPFLHTLPFYGSLYTCSSLDLRACCTYRKSPVHIHPHPAKQSISAKRFENGKETPLEEATRNPTGWTGPNPGLFSPSRHAPPMAQGKGNSPPRVARNPGLLHSRPPTSKRNKLVWETRKGVSSMPPGVLGGGQPPQPWWTRVSPGQIDHPWSDGDPCRHPG